MREGGDERGRGEEEDKESEERGEDDFLFWAQQPPQRWRGALTTAPPGEPLEPASVFHSVVHPERPPLSFSL